MERDHGCRQRNGRRSLGNLDSWPKWLRIPHPRVRRGENCARCPLSGFGSPWVLIFSAAAIVSSAALLINSPLKPVGPRGQSFRNLGEPVPRGPPSDRADLPRKVALLDNPFVTRQ